MFKYLNILNSNDKIKIFLLMVMGIVVSFLDVISIGLVVPLFLILIKPTLSSENYFIDSFFDLLTKYNMDNLNFIIMLIIISFLLKNFLLFLLTYFQSRFTANLNRNISYTFFKKYFSQNYNFFLDKESSKVLSDIHNSVGIFTSKFLASTILITIEIFLIFFILIALINVSPKFTLITFFLFSLVGIIFVHFFKKKIKKNGEDTSKLLNEKLKIIHEVYYNIKDIKIFLKESFFFKKFYENISKMSKIGIFHSILSQSPKFIIEIMAIILITGFIYVSINILNLDKNLIVVNLAIFAAAIYRTVPAFNRVLFHMQMIKFSRPFCKNLLNNYLHLKDKNYDYDDKSSDLGYLKKIELKNISYSYPNIKKNQILKNLSLTLNCNKIIGFKGNSGVGKTSLIDIIIGLIVPDEGSVEVNGFNIKNNIFSWKRKIGYVPQKVNLFKGTIVDNITFFDTEINKQLFQDVTSACEIDDLINRDKNNVNSISDTGKGLSGGQIQRIGIARALYKKPELLILDEATNSLQVDAEMMIIKNLKNIKNLTTIIVSHNENTLNHCEEKYMLNEKSEVKKI